MQGGYKNYLFYLFVVLIVFAVIAFILVRDLRRRKRGKQPKTSITAGNVGIFFDQGKNVSIIPYVKDKYGMGRATGDVISLTYPYTPEKLGKAMRQAMLLCTTGVPGTDDLLMSRLGFRGWKEFSEGKRNISAHYQEGQGIVFNTTRRKADGSYQFNQMGFEKILDTEVSDPDLGMTLLVLYQRCR